MKLMFSALLVSALALPQLASADPWKDESGHGRWNGGWYGETPGWARGRGYWDGHYKHHKHAPPPRVYYGPPVVYGPPVIEYRYYGPVIPAPAPYLWGEFHGGW